MSDRRRLGCGLRGSPNARPTSCRWPDTELIAAAKTARDRLAVIVLLDCGVRKSELAGIRVRDFDLARRTLTVFGKGQKERVLPLRGRVILACEEFLVTPLRALDRTPEPDDYLLYPERRNKHAVSWAKPKARMNGQGAHRWWYYLLRDAGLVEKDVQRGLNMHRARHTFATELRKDSKDLGVVQRMLGHEDIHTTEAYYGHYDLSDLEEAMEKFARRKDHM